MTKKYKLFADCIPIRGYRRCAVCDLSNRNLFHIRESTYIAIAHGDLIDADDVGIDELNALISSNLVFECPPELVGLFPPMRMEHVQPMAVRSAIAELDIQKQYDVREAIEQLSVLGCAHLQILAYADVMYADIESVITGIEGKNIINVDVVLRHGIGDLSVMADRYPFVFSITAYGAPRTDMQKRGGCSILRTTEPFTGCRQCGAVAPNQFVCNREFFFLSGGYNTCLYRKVAIDREGYIRSCPASPQRFGRVGETPIAGAMSQPGFRRLWGITKDRVDVCRDCEFRRICPDCRVFTRNPERPTAHPARCAYNPYLARWAGQAGYAPVEECGEFTPGGFVPDAERIARLLEQQDAHC